ncbi:BTAD domain-containing putative transcriptional regulator [soil metagenome]
MPVRALLLGTPRIACGAEVTLLPATRPALLLAYLACRTTWATRDDLALLFRPDAGDAEARIYLRKLIFRARALPFAHALEVTEHRVRWPVPSDLGDLRRALAEGAWAEAARCDGGVLLEGLRADGAPGLEAWLEVEREAVARSWRRAAIAHAAALDARGAASEAVVWRQRLLEHDPLDEPVLQDLLRTYAAIGSRAQGLTAFDTFARHLEREVGSEPAEVTYAIADALRALPAAESGRGSWAPPARSAVPRPATPFVGRHDEVERIVTLLRAEESRLVSLVGLGGVGKTRIAIEVARRASDDVDGGASFVPLAAAEPRGLLGAVATALGTDDDEARVHAALNERASLLVLDNGETMDADGGPTIARMLEAAPRLRVLVTSRTPIGLAAEHTVTLGGLAVPDPSASVDSDAGALRDSDAVTLFVRRASRVSPDVLDGDEALRTVAQICREVGGLPLAIELAASWTRTMSVDALLAEIRRGSDLLRTDAVDVPERHRSVRGVVEQAWLGLAAEHRAALVRMTVFRGPWSLAAAREVAGADLDTMVALLSASLVRRIDDDRFEMHELIRRAAPSEPDAATRRAHARHTLAWLAAWTHELTAGDQPAALAVVTASLSDVLAAWHHATRHGMVDEIDGALLAIDQTVHARSLWNVGLDAYGAALTNLPLGPATDLVRGRLLVRHANVQRNVGDTDGSRDTLRDALRVGSRLGGRTMLEARLEHAKLEEAVHAYDAAAFGYRQVLLDATSGVDDLRSMAHCGLGNVLFMGEGDASEAMRHYEDALAAARRCGDQEIVTIALINLGAGHYDLGHAGAARRSWREAATIAHRLGNASREAVILSNLAALAEGEGDPEGARDAYERSLSVRQTLGDHRGVARILLNLGRLAHARGAIDEADAYAEASVATYESVDVPGDLAYALATRARFRVALDDVPGAIRMTERALRLGRAASDRKAMLVGLLGVATIDLHDGRSAAAGRRARGVAELAAGREEGVRASALALATEADERLAADAANGTPTGETLVAAAVSLLAEVERALRRA